MLAWQMDNILIVAFASSRSDKEIASQAKINPYVVQKTRSLTNRIDRSSVKRAVDLICNMDEQIKTTKTSPDDGVKLLLLQLAEVFS
jgi:DNA polymerase III delta subunit